MPMGPQEIREHLMANSEEFRKLAAEHSEYAQKLETLSKKSYLTEEEKIEEVNLKKLKLRAKDEMERMIQQYKRELSGAVAR